jgi:maltose O-acetyltransferase
MKSPLKRFKDSMFRMFLNLPLFNRYNNFWYSSLGVVGKTYRFSAKTTVVGQYANITLGNQAEINTGCFLLAKDKIVIGENSTLAYRVTILTSANPNGPHNALCKLYPSIVKPVYIGKNSWIGANATILPGVTVGDYCVVAAGSLVNRDVPDYTLVAGLPAREIKKLDKNVLGS